MTRVRRAELAARRSAASTRTRRVTKTALAALLVVAPLSRAASAATVSRRFEPTDLELEEPGTIELDMQLGATSGERATASRNRAGRFYAPDYEIDLGLSSRVELDVDGSFAFQPLRSRAELTIGEPLWTSVKLGLLDLREVGPARTAAFGLQLGPRLPLGGDLRGVGFQLLTLTAVELGRAHLVLNAGALLDPKSAGASERPTATVGGVDVAIDLEPTKRWSFIGELGGGYYFAGAPHQLTATGGVACDTGNMQWSLVTLVTPVGPADRVGLLFGLAPKLKVF